MLRFAPLLALVALLVAPLRADDGYRLWLRYDRIADDSLRASYAQAITEIVVPAQPDSPWFPRSIPTARDELVEGLRGLLGVDVPVVEKPTRDGALVLGVLTRSPELAALVSERDSRAAGEHGYIIQPVVRDGVRQTLLVANRDIGVLYGAFALLRHIQTHRSVATLAQISAPRIHLRMLNHWDNLDRFIERGYAGQSIWDWFNLPDVLDPRYRDYARANASIGINAVVLTNVNANASVLTREYLEKVAALAGVFRPYGIRVFLTARFSAPIEIGGLKTADPLDPAVREWWQAKSQEIYQLIPDFGGFLVKANSEGQPGPQDYGRTHADGANMLADTILTRGGHVLWRAFVYSHEMPDDRAKQGYSEFQPLDGEFRSNVIVQVKNGAIDFMPREPFHPLFGAMPRTPLALELQITQEYLGGSVHLAYLAPLFEEVLDADTHTAGSGSTVGRIVDGSLDLHGISAIAGVANIGSDRNWTGHPLAQANWYAYGRLAWDHTLSSEAIAKEWIRQTFSNDPDVVQPLAAMLMESREAVVDYSMPLGLHHIMAVGHHYGPGPWVDVKDAGRADWSSVYYHRAAVDGIGFDRTARGSDALSQYAKPVRERWSDPATTPDELLLWFHHLPWDYRTKSGRTLWDELGFYYQRGVDSVRRFQKIWDGLEGKIDAPRFTHVKALLGRQEREAREWRDACLLYFQQFSKRPLPEHVEKPEYSLEHYMSVKRRNIPGDPARR